MTPNTAIAPADSLLNEREAAAILGVARATLRNWRSKGRGPNFVRLQGSTAIRYRREDLNAFTTLQVQPATATTKSTAPHTLKSAARVPFTDLE